MNQEPDNSAPDAEAARIDELLMRYWDGTLDEAGFAELNAALAARPELRATFNDLSLQVLAIRERSAAVKASLPAAGRKPRPWRWLVRVAIAAGLLIAVGLATLHWPGPVDASPIAHLQKVAGDVYIVARGTDQQAVLPNQVFAAGQVVSTVGVDSWAEIQCVGGPRLLLGGNTSVVLPAAKSGKISVKQGNLAVEVLPGPKAARIATPELEVEARDTKLALTVGPRQTVVGVPEPSENRDGNVQVKRLADGQTIPMQPGQFAIASATTDMQPKKLSRVPDTFMFQVGKELPTGWEAGEIVTNDLPEGAEAAVRAVRTVNPRTGGNNYKVSTQNAWTKGLFEIHDDSWLHVRYRVEKPGFFHGLIVCRGLDPTRHGCVLLEVRDLWQKREPNRWYTAHVPFAKMPPTNPEAPQARPLVAFIVVFDAQKVDRGVTVERFWVTRGAEEQ